MDEGGLRDEIGRSVVRFIASAVLHSSVVAGRVGLGPSDSQFLTLLNVHGPLAPGRLAELSGLTTGTVTGVIDRLELGGYVRRDRDGGDRRKVLVTLVPEALEGIAAHYREQGEHLATVLARRDADQLLVIREFFAEMLGGPAATPPSTPPPGPAGRQP